MSSSSQFQSILDSGARNGSPKVHADRITRRRSQSRHRDDEEEEVVVPRISQPYRTSLSAVAPPIRIKKARSRSVSPGGSLVTGRRSRSKSPGNRRSSPKHVTYDERVTVRHSDTEDSIVTDLSGKDSSLELSPQDTGVKSSPNYLSPNSLATSDDSSSHAAELRQTCNQITDWYSRTSSGSQVSSSPGSTMDRLQVSSLHNTSHSPDQSSDFFTSSPGRGDSGVYTDGESTANRGKLNIEKDYNHDRTISYRMAIKAQYSDEVKRLAAANVQEICPHVAPGPRSPTSPTSDFGPRTERSNTLPSKTLTDSDRNLSANKKSVSSSIGNFFRKISPRMSRRDGRRDKSGRSSSSGSAQSLDTSTESNQSFDRSRSSARRSFLKFIGRSRSRSQSKSSDPEDEGHLNKSPKSTDIQTVTESAGTNSHPIPDVTHRILKSIEQNKDCEKTVYQRFKEKQAPGRPGEKPHHVKSQAFKVSPETSPNSVENSSKSDSRLNKENEVQINDSRLISSTPTIVCPEPAKVHPPQSLNVKPVQRPLMRNIQPSFVSSGSCDESIGDCSLDVNLEGGEPTLINSTGQVSVSGSKQVILSQDNLVDLCPSNSLGNSFRDRHPGDASFSPTSADMQIAHGAPVVGLENGALSKHSTAHSEMPRLSNSCEISPKDMNKMPSYLKLSCAVSGYGKYSSYSSRKDINLSSPGASVSSLRSDSSSPDSLLPSQVSRTASLPVHLTKTHLSEVKTAGQVNGQIRDVISNGHSGVYPTGDVQKDGQYYLDLCQTEEERLLVLCGQAKGDMGETTLPEEANGRIRSAIGKTNLLITKKFKQFRGLCHKHMKPDGSDRPTLWEDLQGYWDMVKLQIDDLDELFAEIAFMRQNGWKDIPIRMQSTRSSANSSPKSASLSLSSTPSQTPGHTPATRRKPVNVKDVPDSAPDKSLKAKQTAKAREDARKRLLAEKRAAMKQQKLKAQQNVNPQEVEIFLADSSKK